MFLFLMHLLFILKINAQIVNQHQGTIFSKSVAKDADPKHSQVLRQNSRYSAKTQQNIDSYTLQSVNELLNNVRDLSYRVQNLGSRLDNMETNFLREFEAVRKTDEKNYHRIEGNLGHILSTELNHFYVNIASKFDRSFHEIHQNLNARLNNIESVNKVALSTIQNTRQDVSHVIHIQKSSVNDISTLSELIVNQSESIRSMEMETKRKSKNLTNALVNAIQNSLLNDNNIKSETAKDENQIGLQLQTQHKGDTVSKKSNTESIQKNVSNSKVLQKIFLRQFQSDLTACLNCSDVEVMLNEVKELFEFFMLKSDGLRKNITKHTNEGISLVKLLHQRFSILLRRLNSQPSNDAAILAEIQELEHLIENSFTSILVAQNTFMESCGTDDYLEAQARVAEVLSRLVSNVNLGNEYSRVQSNEILQMLKQIYLKSQEDFLTKNKNMEKRKNKDNKSLSYKKKSKNQHKNQRNETQNSIFNHIPDLTISKNFSVVNEKKLPKNFTKFSIEMIKISNKTLENINKSTFLFEKLEDKLAHFDKNSKISKNFIDDILTQIKDIKKGLKSSNKYFDTFNNLILKFDATCEKKFDFREHNNTIIPLLLSDENKEKFNSWKNKVNYSTALNSKYLNDQIKSYENNKNIFNINHRNSSKNFKTSQETAKYNISDQILELFNIFLKQNMTIKEKIFNLKFKNNTNPKLQISSYEGTNIVSEKNKNKFVDKDSSFHNLKYILVQKDDPSVLNHDLHHNKKFKNKHIYYQETKLEN